VTVNNTGTFGGDGRVTGAVTVNSGGMIRAVSLSAANNPLTLTGGLTLASGAKLGVRISAAGPSTATPGGSTQGTLPNASNNNFLNVTAGGLTAASLNTLNIVIDAAGSTFALNVPYSYQIGTFAGANLSTVNITDQSQFTPVNFGTALFTFSLTGNSSGALFLNLTPVPEPATVLGLAAAGLGLAGFVRRTLRRGGRSAPACA
jgi:hypothetical protein